jgi:hypothetical protein
MVFNATLNNISAISCSKVNFQYFRQTMIYLADNYLNILTMSVIRGYLADNYHHILTMSTISSIFEIERFGVNWFID